jgi:hypothetical protein
VGTKANAALLMNDLNGESGLFFVFHDLSIRIEGVFRLKFTLIDLEGSQGLVQKSHAVTTVFSDPFTVFTPKSFPGMSDSSDLSKTFAAQGLKIPIRKDRTKILSSIKKEGPSTSGARSNIQEPTPEAIADSNQSGIDDEEDSVSNLTPIEKQESTKSLSNQELPLENPTKRARTDSMASLPETLTGISSQLPLEGKPSDGVQHTG